MAGCNITRNQKIASRAIIGALALATLAFCGMAAAGQLYINESGWWRADGAFNASGTPIQAAVGAAGAGDAIFVWNGSYSENVDVDKPQITLEGEDADVVTVTAADAEDPVIHSVTLKDTTPNPGDAILVTVNATDDIGVTSVYANSLLLTNESGIWNGTLTAGAVGTHSVNVSASDAADNIVWDNSTSYSSTTTSSSGASSITSFAPSTLVSNTAGEQRTFNITVNQTVDVTWLINGIVDDTDNDVTEASYKNTSAKIGYWNVSAVASNENGTVVKTWWWTVTASGHATGFWIWDAGRKPPMDLNYTWDARSFTGFYYDLDDDTSTETLTVQLDDYDDRTIDEDDLKYITTAADVDFEHDDWGKYKVIGFMAEKYFAGYEEDNTAIADEDISLISKDMLSKVLIDEDEKHTVSTGASLELKEGYELKVIQLDIDGGQAQVELVKNGKSVDTDIVRSPDNYIYEKDLGKLDDVPLVAVRITSVFAGTESDMLVIEGIFQVSDDYISVDTGDEYDEMEIKSSSRYTIEMRNMDDIDLEADETVDIMGNLKFIVADSETLRFALYEDITSEPGTHDIRGTVYNTTEKPTWDHMNFEGFYYDIDDDLGTEKLEVRNSGNTIDEDNLVYTTAPQPVRFDLDEWGEYEVIGFMAEKYFAGYGGKVKTDKEITSDDLSLISKDMLSKVLIDEDENHIVSTGASLQLEEGYELRVVQLDIDGGQAQVELLKNGKSVDTDIVRSPDTYVYKKDLGKLNDVPIIAIRITRVFAGTETDMVTIEGAFQISDDPISVNNGDKYGEMEITTASSGGITMKNKDNSIDLDSGGTTMITDNIGFKVSDDEKRYYLFVRRTVGSLDSLKINFSEPSVVKEELTITVTAASDGDPVEGAEVTFEGQNLGLTDSNGEVRFTSEESGTFTVTAIKENYDSASEDVRILTGDGRRTTTDAVIALQIAAGSRPPDLRWDVSGDKRVTSLDALMILQAAAGKVDLS